MCPSPTKAAYTAFLFSFIFIFFCSLKVDQSPTEKLKSGDISGCSFYNTDSNMMLKFKDGVLTCTKWSGALNQTGIYKLDEYSVSYGFSKHGMSGNINGIPFIVLSKAIPNGSTFYIRYSGLNYFLYGNTAN